MQRRRPFREKRKKSKSRNKLIYGTVAVILILVFSLAYSSFNPKNPSTDNQTSHPKAALVDHLSFSSPPRNEFERVQWETFKGQCRTLLEDAGFSYTYYKGEEVKVDFYANLPAHNYSLILLRVHSAVVENTTWIGLFTSETYDETKYRDKQEDGQLVIAYFNETGPRYFGITPKFVQNPNSMIGSFQKTVIIMMGCEGLKPGYTSMAEAFIQRGAEVYISWTGLVSIDHTDQSTILLLQNLLQKNQTVAAAVNAIPPDPTWLDRLDYYPHEAGGLRIHDLISGLTMKVAETKIVSLKSCQFKLVPIVGRRITKIFLDSSF